MSTFVANAVSRVDNLSFLEDIVPRTTTVREFKSRKARAAAQENAPALQNGQTTLDASARPAASRPIPQELLDVIPPLLRPIDPQTHPGQLSPTNGQQLRFEHYEPNGSIQRDEGGDVEMT